MVEAVEPFKLHITSMSYLYEVFEPLQLLCIDIWMHTHSITTTDVPPDLVELAKSLGDELLPWVCRTKPIRCKRFGSPKQCWSYVLDALDTWQVTDNIIFMKEWSYHRQHARLDQGGTNSVGEQFDYQFVALDHPFHVPPPLIFILHPLFCKGRCGHGAFCILLYADDGALYSSSHCSMTSISRWRLISSSWISER